MFGKWKKAAAVILPGILLMGMLSGCGKGSQKSSSAKNSITISLHQDPPKLDPMLSTAFVDRIVFQSLYDKLVDLDSKGNIIPMLPKNGKSALMGKRILFI